MKNRPVCLVLLLLILLIILFTGNRVYMGTFLQEDELTLPDGEKLWLIGEVEKKEPTTEGYAVVVKKAYVENMPQKQYCIQVYISKEMSCRIGDKIKMYVKIKRLQVSRNKGMFNQALYYKAKRIQYTGNVKEIQVLERGNVNIREGIFKLRILLYLRLKSVFPEDVSEVLAAILLGIKSGIEEETKNLYQKAGILHLISISGLHISCIGLGMYHLLRKLGVGFGKCWIVTLAFLSFYGMLSGASVSSKRAIIMAGLMMGAWYLGRTYDLITALSCGALIILVQSPYELYQAGFQLSFGAVLGIGIVSPELVKAFGKNHRILEAMVMNLGIQLTTLPIVLYYYYEIPLYSLIVNLLLVPFMSLVLGTGLLGIFASYISVGLGQFWGAGAVVLLRLYEKTAAITVGMPCSNLRWGQPSMLGILGYYLVLLGGIYLIHTMNRRKDKILQEEKHLYKEYGWEDQWNYASICIILFACLLLKYHIQQPLKITMLDVGQGDGIVIEHRREGNYLVDGGSTDVTKVGKYRILPFLKAEGISKLQGIFISHMDSDHISGIKELLEYHVQGELEIERIYLPKLAQKDEVYIEMEEKIRQQQIEIVYLSRGMELQEENMKIKLLQPVATENYQERNEYSMVFRLEYQKFSMLFTGDVEGKGEKEMLQCKELEKTTILKTAHHGSEYTMCEEVLSQIQPKFTWISCGKGNSYGHPHQALLDRISKMQSEIYITMNQGAITVETDGEHMIIYDKCKQ